MTCRRRLAVFLCALMAAASWHAHARGAAGTSPVLKTLAKVSGGRNTMLPTKPAGTLTRLGRGAKGIALSPLEIPATMRRVANDRDVFTGVWAGGLEGLGNGLSRLLAGLVEIASSPIPSKDLPLYTKKLGERASPPVGVPTDLTRP